jgi:aspartyl-tRNA(Asn)/glutamyl-tRNA(Gln) amidotransferase subunit A
LETMSTDLLSLGIVDLATKLEKRELSPLELLEHYLSRIDQVNPKLNAFVAVSADDARRAAKAAGDEIRSGRYKGPLHGIPLGIKDIIDTSGIRTTYGSAIFRNNIPEKDATVVSRLKEAGAIILGKTNTHEFAFGVTMENLHYGTTRNPWATNRIPGGSSGGSAAAVAACMCCAAVGTDTGGSVRIPSAFCGVVGLKPTYGRVSTAGVFALAIGMDHVGLIARSVVDIALMLQTIAGFDLADPRSLMTAVPDFYENIGDSVEGAKVAISPDLIPKVMDPQVESAYKKATSKIESLGGEILERSFKASDLIERVSTTLLLAEAAAQHAELLEKSSDRYGANVIDRFRAGQKIKANEYIRALREKEVIYREIEILFKDADFLLTPSVQILPPKIGEKKIMVGTQEMGIIPCCARFTRLANITGIPAIVLPFGYSADGLPLSIQLMTPRLYETGLLRFAHALETATPELRNRKPML